MNDQAKILLRMKKIVTILFVLVVISAFFWLTRTKEVAIVDGKTIDFSSGRAVVTDSAKDREAIARAVKEMNEATKNVVFTPVGKQPVKAKSKPKDDDADDAFLLLMF